MKGHPSPDEETEQELPQENHLPRNNQSLDEDDANSRMMTAAIIPSEIAAKSHVRSKGNLDRPSYSHFSISSRNSDSL